MENNKKQKDLKIYNFLKILLFILLTILAYVIYTYCIKYYNEYLNLKVSIDNYRQIIIDKDKKISEYNSELGRYENQIEFMNNHVAICPLDGSGLYHKYGCEHSDTSSFMIYNTEQAPNEGYLPCPYCFGETSNTSDDKTEIVYITNTGSKYHRASCSYLKSKKAITKEKAISQGFSPCSRCNP